ARRGAERLRELLEGEQPVQALGASTGNQAVQQVKAGLEAIYVSGWQVAADTDWYVPIVADAEAGFGGTLNCFELMKTMIEAGAAGVHFEGQQASEKKCGHMGGKVLLPTAQAVRNLVAARLAADVEDVPTVLIARTDALGADMMLSDADSADERFLTGERTEEGLEEAEQFAAAIHAEFPDRMPAYNCSPSFNWKSKLSDDEIEGFVTRLGELGYRFQFITLAGFHTLNHSMFELARGYRDHGMTAYAELQQREFANEENGYTATSHQREVGAGYFDEVAEIISGGKASTGALSGSTEEAQFG
ncbi:MAG: isocitrate lyase/phosphoenolpyruvate mutase family protein, partial [Actinomycetota bacterium]|nr:isocitrate lyase/phosphoenolpyruvate mutase family protein [Actinomycetota bacterium]